MGTTVNNGCVNKCKDNLMLLLKSRVFSIVDLNIFVVFRHERE